MKNSIMTKQIEFELVHSKQNCINLDTTDESSCESGSEHSESSVENKSKCDEKKERQMFYEGSKIRKKIGQELKRKLTAA